MVAVIPDVLCEKMGTAKGRCELMKQYPGLWTGRNADGESVLVAISLSGIKVSTNQKNGWVRVNYYDAEGLPSGETFDGKWDQDQTGAMQ